MARENFKKGDLVLWDNMLFRCCRDSMDGVHFFYYKEEGELWVDPKIGGDVKKLHLSDMLKKEIDAGHDVFGELRDQCQ